MECKLKQREFNALLFDKLKTQEFKKLQRIAIKRVFGKIPTELRQCGYVWKLRE